MVNSQQLYKQKHLALSNAPGAPGGRGKLTVKCPIFYAEMPRGVSRVVKERSE